MAVKIGSGVGVGFPRLPGGARPPAQRLPSRQSYSGMHPRRAPPEESRCWDLAEVLRVIFLEVVRGRDLGTSLTRRRAGGDFLCPLTRPLKVQQRWRKAVQIDGSKGPTLDVPATGSYPRLLVRYSLSLIRRVRYQVKIALLSRLLSNQTTFSSRILTGPTSRQNLLDVGARARNRTVNLGIKRGQKVSPPLSAGVHSEQKRPREVASLAIEIHCRPPALQSGLQSTFGTPADERGIGVERSLLSVLSRSSTDWPNRRNRRPARPRGESCRGFATIFLVN